MSNVEFSYDMRSMIFTHEPSGFTFKKEDINRYSNHELGHIFYGATGLQLDDLLLDTMRDM